MENGILTINSTELMGCIILKNENYGVNGKYNHPSLFYRPGTNEQGEHVTYRADSLPYGIEDGRYHQPGSFLGIDGKRYSSGWYYGLDGLYHHPDTYYDIMTGKYTPTPPPKK